MRIASILWASVFEKIFRKAKKGGVLMERADVWAPCPKDLERIHSIPSVCFLGGPGVIALPSLKPTVK